ncbi:N-methyl-L-tryptophan oxidase [Caldilinea sp.]|uniref:N-methyl-L-tryptophan oxidase n=1 Tax=Caldilinea sp. TaxID=2293560 RepID=UPI002C6BD5CF|nr:N-methyl-L-tryptophan oxidase [Caldilinea sp.]
MNAYSRHYNTIVIGVGGMGSATCYDLARRGQSVLGIEQFDIPHDQGSSHGYTRIIRLAYYEHPSYVMLLKRAYELWEDIERVSGEKLLYKIGSIDAGPADSWVFKGSFQSVVQMGIDHEVLTGIELNRRFPGYRLPQESMALYQKDGGFLTPERGVVSYVNAALAHGAEIHGRETVLGWAPRGDGVRVTTDRAEYTADALVFTAGAWNSQLMPWLHGLATPELQVLIWMQPERPEYFRLDNFPVFNCLVEEGRFYGFPVFGVPGFKFGKYHHFEEQGRPHEIKRAPGREDEAMLREFAARYFPHATGPTLTLKECMFTNAPDGHFIIDLHPEFPQVSFASACSGHGYKFASVIGEILADLAERQQSRHDISLFALSRFGGRPSKLHREKIALIERGLPAGEGHPGYGAGARGEGRGSKPSISGIEMDTAHSSYWQRADVTPFW